MNAVEFSELESVSLSLWAELQKLNKSVQEMNSGGCGSSCDCASIRDEFAKMHGIIKGGFLFINIKGVPIKISLSFGKLQVRINELHTYSLSNNYKNI